MKAKEIATLKYREIDLLQNKIDQLKKEQFKKHNEINFLKDTLIKENDFMIGKKALCSIDHDINFQNVECTCNKVICSNDFIPIPLFLNKNNKKVDVDYYEWL